MALDSAAVMALDDWNLMHGAQAHDQGWSLCETGHPGHSGIEIKPAFDLEDDVHAVARFRNSFDLQEDHALSAYMILQSYSTMEFMHWHMHSWREKTG